ncbi:MAG: hemerythrin domain-containing protein [Nitrococcus mobilis]|nr:hemerythrin domain-containing protein [Nitrococcus mobilis]
MHVLDQLLSRHEKIRAVLDMLEQEVESLDQGGSADLSAMKEGFYYLTQYLGPGDNSRERIVYRNVVARERRAARLVGELTQQHEELRRRSEELLESVEDMTEDVLVAKAEFDARAHRYIELQRQHVAREENELLPLADQLLTDDDWKRIERTLRQQQWPSLSGIAPIETSPTVTGSTRKPAAS